MKLTLENLEAAVSLKREIVTLESRLESLLNDGETVVRRVPQRRKRVAGITAAGRRRLSENMKARWAARRKMQKRGR